MGITILKVVHHCRQLFNIQPNSRPAHVAQWPTHSGAMCSGAWRASWARFKARSGRVRLPPKNHFK